MSASQRRKGRNGQTEFAKILVSRDYIVDQITAGIMREDLIATKDGKSWSVEVKNCATITPEHRKQAQEQGRRRRLPWMLASKIAGTSSWLVQIQGERPRVWHA